MSKKRIILSVGGSIISPEGGPDAVFLKKFRTLILKHVRKGVEFVMVVGGGLPARQYQAVGKQFRHIKKNDLDWIGIAATKFNASFVQQLFNDKAASEVVEDPNTILKTRKPIIMASGWRPGCSTDLGAVLLAKAYKAKSIYNLSNVAYVYDKDPNKFQHAQKIETIDWKTFRKDIVGNTWEPGKNVPFDPIASKLAQKYALSVGMVKGTDLREVDRALSGKSFRGTIIS